MDEVSLRRARVHDVDTILRIVRPSAEQGQMLPLTVGDVTDRLRDFQVLEAGGRALGVVAVRITWGRLVELRSLAVLEEARGRGYGDRLVRAALDDARALGAEDVFTLTYIPDFFRRYRFTDIDRASLPHKVWLDCVNCPKFPDCGEVALRRPVADVCGGKPKDAP